MKNTKTERLSHQQIEYAKEFSCAFWLAWRACASVHLHLMMMMMFQITR